ncbi:unnamed protein product, partial [Pylaiella littoralis]
MMRLNLLMYNSHILKLNPLRRIVAIDGDSTSDGNSGDKKKPKTEDEIKEILSKVSVIKTPDNLEELKTEIIHTFGHL